MKTKLIGSLLIKIVGCVTFTSFHRGISYSLAQPNIINNNNVNKLFTSSNHMMNQIPQPAERIKNEPESVWVEFVQLALEHKPLNLGQGFPDFAAPKYLIESLHNATKYSDNTTVLNNQYTRSFGHPRFVKALVNYYKKFRAFKQLEDPNQQVLITVGAYEGLFASIMGFVNPGDEVILIDPAFDAYAPIVEMAQGKSVYVPLRNTKPLGDSTSQLNSADFKLDMKEFESKITNKTKMLVLNTPNNPLGKIFSLEELQSIAELCIKHNILVLADEVYEQMYYAPEQHLSICQLPGMWNRTITVGSAGKSFSVTGWKIGWALGPKHLLKFVQLIHQTAIYTVATPLQESVARALEHEIDLLEKEPEKSYWLEMRSDLEKKRNRMGAILQKAKMTPVIPQGGYFMMADFSPLASNFSTEYKTMGRIENKSNTNDYLFARWLSSAKKLQGIPGSAFYSPLNKPLAENLIRFCFIKQDSTLDKLEALIESLTNSTNSKSQKSAL